MKIIKEKREVWASSEYESADSQIREIIDHIDFLISYHSNKKDLASSDKSKLMSIKNSLKELSKINDIYGLMDPETELPTRR